MLESPSLGVLQNHRDVALRDVVIGYRGLRGLNEVILVVFFSLNDSLILYLFATWGSEHNPWCFCTRAVMGQGRMSCDQEIAAG